MHLYSHLQLPISKQEKDLYAQYGDSNFSMIRGAGQLERPHLMLVFMNPTARNITSSSKWKGLKAPWIGTKLVWSMLFKAGILDKDYHKHIQTLKPQEWDGAFSEALYNHIAQKDLYITNLASCTQCDARPLSNTIFREYVSVLYKEITITKPKHIITFGNQVSSIVLEHPISVSEYVDTNGEVIEIDSSNFRVFPTYYPVGQGQRNMPFAIERIKKLYSLRTQK